MTTSNYTVTGMTCGHCVQAVTEEVSAIDGVTDVSVELQGGRLTITSDQPIELERVAEAVDEAGDYQVTPA
ncbi:heavy-metal-associated domain-containing protein [Naumannella sp. ID2617S]|uniref:Heavy metal transporter n=1 Tax=Enemella dayhoffiae TaxID=2016507 RepID=A0A255HBV3_9ACTN|nr:heavy-metal-associated domain-containing protein [Enemella dayhoffiae]NNG19867.1 heavy-metal-associated domain-containing protein [Naumannella sp. ID2617S]OYO25115.1 heavy metal transporter [Enemella dayhoffiae]